MRDIEELRELREYDAGVPPLDDAVRARVRARLLAAVTAEDEPLLAVRHRRPAVRIVATALLVTALLGSILVAGAGGPARHPAMRNAAAQTVLNGAARYARQHEQAAHPRDDQFVYTRETIRETDRKTGATTTYTDEDWRSVDGTRPSWIMEIGKGWWAQPLPPGQILWPPEDWASLRKLPTDPEKLIVALVPGGVPATKGDPLRMISDQQWSQVHYALAGMLKLVPVMPKGLRPAAFEALGMVPGAKLVPRQKDARGRTGVAVAYDDPTRPGGGTDSAGYFIFDPKTYEFLGFRDERVSGEGAAKKDFTQLSSLDSWAVVDKAKQRP
ncbi:CU044_5270 family protein [Streptomyces sp. NPDC020983]|uniref:CU044_5270 family protein n=1 Tax=Streptomyces sp. NPDC020983 TaxID=3365106 RepID=UPI0037955826